MPHRDIDWGTFLVQRLIYPLAEFLAPASTLALTIFLVAQSFSDSFEDGIQSLASALAPLVVLAFLIKVGPRFSQRLGQASSVNPSSMAYSVPAAPSTRTMISRWLMLRNSQAGRFSARVFKNNITAFFLAFGISLLAINLLTAIRPEVVTSTTFSALAFFETRSREQKARVDSYYLGVVLGGLTYIAIFGIPTL